MATAEAMADDDPLPTRPRTARIPRIVAGQGPSDGQFMVALTGPDTKTHICDKVHYCPNCKVKEQHLDLCCDNVCKWCDKTGHYSAYYPMPLTLCGFTECHIPTGHPLRGL